MKHSGIFCLSTSLSMSWNFSLMVTKLLLHIQHHISFQAERREKSKSLKRAQKSFPAVKSFKKSFPLCSISLNTLGSQGKQGGWKGKYFSFLASQKGTCMALETNFDVCHPIRYNFLSVVTWG